MMTMIEKRYVRVSILLLPFVLYTAVMLKMIDNACQSDMLQTQPLPTEQRNEDTQSANSTSSLHNVLKKYEDIEIQRAKLLEQINSLISAEPSQGANPSNDMVFKYFNTKNLRELKGFDRKESRNIHSGNVQKPKYLFNCTNIHEIKLVRKVGHGVSKQAFLGKFNGHSVAVKMVTRHQKEVRTCLEGLRDGTEKAYHRSRCFVFPTMKLMKEILLLEQLDHPGFVQLLGYCVRSEESDSTDMSEHGVVAIYEYGERIVLENLQFLPIDKKLQNALSLAKFLYYLEYSPLGSLRVKDFKEGHFLLVNSSLKMIDLDDVDNIEPSCDIYSEMATVSKHSNTNHRTCDHSVHCQMGLCIGYNAKQNLKSMNSLFFKRLLYPVSYPNQLSSAIVEINARLDTLSITSLELIDFLDSAISHLHNNRH